MDIGYSTAMHIFLGLMHCELSHLELKLIDAARKVPEDAGIKSKSCHV